MHLGLVDNKKKNLESRMKEEKHKLRWVLASSVFLILGVLLPFSLYRHSDFFGWSAPRGLELEIVSGFALTMLVALILSLTVKSFAAIAMTLSLMAGSIIGFLSPWVQADPFWAKPGVSGPEQIWKVKRIAHAGGAVSGIYYSNSLEALELNKQYFDYFEIDFSLTTDKQLVCLHSWNEEVHESLFGRILKEPVSLLEFEEMATQGELEPCTLSSLQLWVENNPDKKIVTDIKALGKNVTLLRQLKSSHPVLSSSVIPQAYSLGEVQELYDLGFEDVILTTYRMNRDYNEEEFLESASRLGIFAVAMTSGEAGDLSSKLSAAGIPVYVFTVNDHAWFAQLRKYSVSNVYTDTLIDTEAGY